MIMTIWPPKRWKIIIISFLILLLLYLLRPLFWQNPTILDRCVKLDSPLVGDLAGLPYYWITTQSFVQIYRNETGEWSCLLYNISDHSKRSIEHVNRFLATKPGRNWQLRVHTPLSVRGQNHPSFRGSKPPTF